MVANTKAGSDQQDHGIMEAQEFFDLVFEGAKGHIALAKAKPGKDGKLTFPTRLLEDQEGQEFLASPWRGGKARYTCVSTVNGERNEWGNALRKRPNIVEIRAIVLDDLMVGGVKAPDKWRTDENGVEHGQFPVENLKAPLSMLIETSKDNYQGIYFLEPLGQDELLEYEAFVKILGLRGYGDPGADGSYRLFRIPGSKHKSGFRSRVVECEAWVYAFGDLKKHYEVTDEDVGAVKKRPTPTPLPLPEGAEIADPIATWLYENGRVLNDRGEWLDITCLWAEPNDETGGHTEHTNDSATSYSPLGRGDDPGSRGFFCMHGHCRAAEIDTRRFLDRIAELGGPRVHIREDAAIQAAQLNAVGQALADRLAGEGAVPPAICGGKEPEPAAEPPEKPLEGPLGPQVWPRHARYPELPRGTQGALKNDAALGEIVTLLASRFVYCPGHDRWLDLANIGSDGWQLRQSAMKLICEGFYTVSHSNSGKATITDAYDNLKRLKLTVRPPVMRPDMPPGLFEHDGAHWVNLCRIPELPQDGGNAKCIWRYLRWLYPIDAEHEWFLLRLRHKILHPGIPGPAIINVAQRADGKAVEGTGRGRLAPLLRALFGAPHVKSLEYADVLNMGKAGWNDFIEYSLWGIVNEVASTDDSISLTAKLRQADFLKTIMEPGAEVTQRRKRGIHDADVVNHMSWMLHTNHADAIALSESNRRIEVLQNPDVPIDRALVVELMACLENPANVAAFKRELIAFEGSGKIVFDPYAPPPDTPARRRMIEAHKSELDVRLDDVFAALPDGLVTKEMVNAALADLRDTLPPSWSRIAYAELRRRSDTLTDSAIHKGQLRVTEDDPGVRAGFMKSGRRVVARALAHHAEWMFCDDLEAWRASLAKNWCRLIKAGLIEVGVDLQKLARELNVIEGGDGSENRLPDRQE